jgi:excisionase family DNA binding protein
MFEGRLLVTVTEAAKALTVSPWTVRKWIDSGRLRRVKIGRRVGLEPSELERLLSAGRDPARVKELENEKLAGLI